MVGGEPIKKVAMGSLYTIDEKLPEKIGLKGALTRVNLVSLG